MFRRYFAWALQRASAFSSSVTPPAANASSVPSDLATRSHTISARSGAFAATQVAVPHDQIVSRVTSVAAAGAAFGVAT
jgi:hypothetical protein